jgi:hypothetical protein
MSQLSIFIVDFQITKPSAGGAAGAASALRHEKRRVTLSAASSHPHDILQVLSNNFTLGSGEAFEILGVQPASTPGTEGNIALS